MASAPIPAGLEVPFVTERLRNGLAVVVAPLPGVPVVTVDVTYDVGSRVEEPGRTGLAHLFEHLMFEGSERVPKGEHARLVTSAGGVFNGTTTEERTNYFATLPAEALELGLFLEADRMRALDLTQENLDRQREAVKEEKRLRIDNQPYGLSFQEADSLAYESFAYRHPVIGSMEDLDAASLADARDFHRRHYSPANALLCVTGDVEPAAALQAVREQFGELPARERPAPVEVVEPPPAGERRLSVTDPHALFPALHLDVKAPPRRHGDLLALAYVEKVLGGGESGRLWRRLVKDEERALSLSISVDERRGPSLLRVFAIARDGVGLDLLEREIREDLARVAGDGLSPREMERARRMLEADAVRALQTSQSVAFVLSEYGLYDGEPGLFRDDLGRLLSLTAAEVRDAAARLLRPEAYSVVEVRPGAEGTAGAEA